MKTFENRPFLWGIAWTMIMTLLYVVAILFRKDHFLLSQIVYGSVILIVNFLLCWRSPYFHNTLSGEQIALFLRLTLVLTVIGIAYFLGLYLLQNSLMIEFHGVNPRFEIFPIDIANIICYVPVLSMVANGYFTTAAIHKYGLRRSLVVSGFLLTGYISLVELLPGILLGYSPSGYYMAATVYFIVDLVVLPSTLFLVICQKWNIQGYNWTFFFGFTLLFFCLVDFYYAKYFPGHHLFTIPVTGDMKGESYLMHALGIALQIALIFIAAKIRPRKALNPVPEESTLIDN